MERGKQLLDVLARLDAALAQNADLVAQVAKLNERVAELLPVAKRKARKTKTTAPGESAPPALTEEQRRAFENRPRPPTKPVPEPTARAAQKPTGRSALPVHLGLDEQSLRPKICASCSSTELHVVDVVPSTASTTSTSTGASSRRAALGALAHAALLARHGGASGIRDMGLLESARARARSGYYASLSEQAAALLQSLALNHAFVDGNKRVAWAASMVFLRLNGYRVRVGTDAGEHFLIERVIVGRADIATIAGWLERHM